MAAIPSIPLPLDPSPPQEADDKRLWIGNLDSRLTEYQLIKVLQRFGSVKKFDFLFHKAGPLKGQPRGYCFVTYESRSQAENALKSLNGTQAISKKLLVKWANSVPSEDSSTTKKPQLVLPGISVKQDKSNKTLKSQIKAIEAKLKSMQNEGETELERCLTSTAKIEQSSKVLKSKNRSRPYPEARRHSIQNR